MRSTILIEIVHFFYSFASDNLVRREEKLEVINKGQADQYELYSGFYVVKGEDGYKYFIRYTIDNNGKIQICVDRAPFRRIPPNALKSLVG